MSPPENTLVLSAAAQDDFEDIILYTLQNWGEEQATEYASVIDRALNAIQDNPRLGHRRPDIASGYLCFHAGQHLILYRMEGSLIFVVRILHGRMDIRRHIHGKP